MPGRESLWDELMGLVDPSVEDPTPEPQGIAVGRLNDDDTYERHSEEHIRRQQWNVVSERLRQERVTRESLEAMGFEIVEEESPGKTLFEELGGVISGN